MHEPALHEIIITRDGVPHETWTTPAKHPAADRARCYWQRMSDRSHKSGDIYEVIPDTGYTDEQALDLAFYLASLRMPALRERFIARLALVGVSHV